MQKEKFIQDIQEGYQFKGSFMTLGAAMLGGEVLGEAQVKVCLKTLNRHGLITGATGTGKTKTLQIVAEQLSLLGVPSLVMDIKGDLSGVAVPGDNNTRIADRHTAIQIPFEPHGSPVEFLTLSDEPGARLRATVTEFGPILFSKILGLNDTQSGLLAVVFKYCDDRGYPLLDLRDIKQVLQYIQDAGKPDFESEYGRVSTSTVGIILRRIIELEGQGAETFFGEQSFEVEDLLRQKDGKGMISILRLTDLQDRPKLFSTFMLQLLAEVYSSFPEVGDLDKPKLVIFIDEAHLVFQEASRALLNQIETVVRLIRSKGVGIVFCTQNPTDIPDIVLSQLGLKLQHSLRAFTAKDRRAIRQSAENFPISSYYNVADLITNLGVGEALVTGLDEKGRPTPLAHTMLRAPVSRMDILTDMEIQHIIRQSGIISKYNRVIDRDSAFEILNAKVARINREAEVADPQPSNRRTTTIDRNAPSPTRRPTSTTPRTTSTRRGKSTVEKMLDNTVTRQMGRTFTREVTRGILGALGVGPKRRR